MRTSIAEKRPWRGCGLARTALTFLLLSALTPPAAVSEPVREDAPDLGSRKRGEDWPRFQGPNGDSKSSETGLLGQEERAAASPPAVLWHVELGEGYSAPSIAKGRLFHFGRFGDHARLTAVESETGRELWRSEYSTSYEDYYGYSGGPRSAPTIDRDRVFALGVDGVLRAHDVVDGRVLWEIDTEERYGVVQNFFGVGSSPLVDGDLLIVPIGGSPPGTPRIHSERVVPNGTGLVALDVATGEERWRSADELASYASPIIRRVAGERLGLHLARGGLVAFDPTSGGVRWRVPFRARRLESVNAATPVVVGDEVFITESYELGGRLLKMSATTAEPVWSDGRRQQAMAAHWSTPVEHEGYLYGSSGEKTPQAELRCLDWRTGEIRWSVPGLKRSQLLYVDAHFVVNTEYGEVLLIAADPDEYREVWRFRPRGRVGGAERDLLRYPSWAAPVLARGILYLRGERRLVALELIPDRP